MMDDYRASYLHLWRGVTAAIEAIERRNYGLAEDLLQAAQRDAEEAFISQADAEPAAPRIAGGIYNDQ